MFSGKVEAVMLLRAILVAALVIAFSACEAEKQQKPKVEAAAATLFHAAAIGR